jgi:hypothetical protein
MKLSQTVMQSIEVALADKLSSSSLKAVAAERGRQTYGE